MPPPAENDDDDDDDDWLWESGVDDGGSEDDAASGAATDADGADEKARNLPAIPIERSTSCTFELGGWRASGCRAPITKYRIWWVGGTRK